MTSLIDEVVEEMEKASSIDPCTLIHEAKAAIDVIEKRLLSDEVVESVCDAVVLGEDEAGCDVYIHPTEAKAALTAAMQKVRE